VTPSASGSIDLRFDILGYRVQLATRSRVVEHLVRGLYRGYPDNSAGQPDAMFQVKTIRRNGNRVWALTAQGDEIGAHCSLGPVLNQLEYEICRRVIEHRRDLIWLHGALVSRDGAALFISGKSGAGKTTLSLALSARGFSIETDDVALLDGYTTNISPIPRCFHLYSRSKQLLRGVGLKFKKQPLRHNFLTPSDLACASHCSTPALFVSLSRSEASSAALLPITQAEMTALLLEQSAWGWRSAREVLCALARLTQHARCYKLIMGRLDASAQALDKLSSSATSGDFVFPGASCSAHP